MKEVGKDVSAPGSAPRKTLHLPARAAAPRPDRPAGSATPGETTALTLLEIDEPEPTCPRRPARRVEIRRGRALPPNPEVDEALRHWGRFCRERPAPGRCRSLESRYRSPRGQEVEFDDGPPAPLPVPAGLLDLALASRLEELILALPVRVRRALKFAYVYHADGKWSARRLRMRASEWDAFLDYAKMLVSSGFTRTEIARKIRFDYSTPSSDETPEPRGSGSYGSNA